jgi:N-acetylneuraminate synthase
MYTPSRTFRIGNDEVGEGRPVYFIADIAANHDGDLDRARRLIDLAAHSGAQAAKFQHFSAKTIVSDSGFKALAGKQSHQAEWKKSVYEVYEEASVSLDWTQALADACCSAGITFLTTPYAVDLADHVDSFVPAYKVGSGDITWTDFIRFLAGKRKPMILATGAATADDVARAVAAALHETPDVALLQCNTNYTGSTANFAHVQLNVLNTFRSMFPGMILGLSDHTPGHAAVLGAVALGGKIVEKHFTDDTMRDGPDHRFSMTPATWRDMVARSRELEAALGTGLKAIEDNERETIILQRRSLRAARALPSGHIVADGDFAPLRPCPADAYPLSNISAIVGRRLTRAISAGDYLRISDLE